MNFHVSMWCAGHHDRQRPHHRPDVPRAKDRRHSIGDDHLAFTARAGERTYSFRDVGADQERIQPDGTLVLSVIGQPPFEFTGILRINVDTGEVILEPRDRSAEQLRRTCSALTGG